MSEAGKKKPFRIFIDEVKIRHTSHWDEDFMSRAELEAAYAPKPAAPPASTPEEAPPDDAKKD